MYSDAASPQCPRCGSHQFLIKGEICHLLVEDPDGPLPSSSMFPRPTAWRALCAKGNEMLRQRNWPDGVGYSNLPGTESCFECFNARLELEKSKEG